MKLAARKGNLAAPLPWGGVVLNFVVLKPFLSHNNATDRAQPADPLYCCPLTVRMSYPLSCRPATRPGVPNGSKIIWGEKASTGFLAGCIQAMLKLIFSCLKKVLPGDLGEHAIRDPVQNNKRSLRRKWLLLPLGAGSPLSAATLSLLGVPLPAQAKKGPQRKIPWPFNPSFPSARPSAHMVNLFHNPSPLP